MFEHPAVCGDTLRAPFQLRVIESDRAAGRDAAELLRRPVPDDVAELVGNIHHRDVSRQVVHQRAQEQVGILVGQLIAASGSDFPDDPEIFAFLLAARQEFALHAHFKIAAFAGVIGGIFQMNLVGFAGEQPLPGFPETGDVLRRKPLLRRKRDALLIRPEPAGLKSSLRSAVGPAVEIGHLRDLNGGVENAVLHLQSVALTVFLGNVPEHQHGAGDFAGMITDGRGAVGDVPAGAVPCDQVGVVGKFDDLSGGKRAGNRGKYPFPVEIADDMEDIVQLASDRFFGRISGQLRRNRVDHRHVFAAVGGDHAVADGLQGDPQLFFRLLRFTARQIEIVDVG